MLATQTPILLDESHLQTQLKSLQETAPEAASHLSTEDSEQLTGFLDQLSEKINPLAGEELLKTIALLENKDELEEVLKQQTALKEKNQKLKKAFAQGDDCLDKMHEIVLQLKPLFDAKKRVLQKVKSGNAGRCKDFFGLIDDLSKTKETKQAVFSRLRDRNSFKQVMLLSNFFDKTHGLGIFANYNTLIQIEETVNFTITDLRYLKLSVRQAIKSSSSGLFGSLFDEENSEKKEVLNAFSEQIKAFIVSLIKMQGIIRYAKYGLESIASELPLLSDGEQWENLSGVELLKRYVKKQNERGLSERESTADSELKHEEQSRESKLEDVVRQSKSKSAIPSFSECVDYDPEHFSDFLRNEALRELIQLVAPKKIKTKENRDYLQNALKNMENIINSITNPRQLWKIGKKMVEGIVGQHTDHRCARFKRDQRRTLLKAYFEISQKESNPKNNNYTLRLDNQRIDTLIGVLKGLADILQSSSNDLHRLVSEAALKIELKHEELQRKILERRAQELKIQAKILEEETVKAKQTVQQMQKNLKTTEALVKRMNKGAQNIVISTQEIDKKIADLDKTKVTLESMRAEISSHSELSGKEALLLSIEAELQRIDELKTKLIASNEQIKDEAKDIESEAEEAGKNLQDTLEKAKLLKNYFKDVGQFLADVQDPRNCFALNWNNLTNSFKEDLRRRVAIEKAAQHLQESRSPFNKTKRARKFNDISNAIRDPARKCEDEAGIVNNECARFVESWFGKLLRNIRDVVLSWFCDAKKTKTETLYLKTYQEQALRGEFDTEAGSIFEAMLVTQSLLATKQKKESAANNQQILAQLTNEGHNSPNSQDKLRARDSAGVLSPNEEQVVSDSYQCSDGSKHTMYGDTSKLEGVEIVDDTHDAILSSAPSSSSGG